MPIFSQLSLTRLATCHPDLQVLMKEVIKHVDITILEGHRDKEAQEKAFSLGNTKLHWPHGKHNASPAMALDVAPYPVNFDNSKRFYYMAGITMALAEKLREEGKISRRVRWGGNWSENPAILDEKGLIDLPHIELMEA